MNACLASAGCPLRLFQPVPWVTQDALGNPNAFRSSKSNAKVGIEPEKAGHREFPGGPPSKYYPGPTMLNFRDLTRSGAFIVVWTCHDRVRFLGVFKPCFWHLRDLPKSGQCLLVSCPEWPVLAPVRLITGTAQPPDGLCSILEDGHEPLAGVPRLAGA